MAVSGTPRAENGASTAQKPRVGGSFSALEAEATQPEPEPQPPIRSTIRGAGMEQAARSGPPAAVEHDMQAKQEVDSRLWRQHHAALAQLEAAHPRFKQFGRLSNVRPLTTGITATLTQSDAALEDSGPGRLTLADLAAANNELASVSWQATREQESVRQLVEALRQWGVGGTTSTPEACQVFVEHELPGLVTTALAEAPELLNVVDSYGWGCNGGDGYDRFCVPLSREDLVHLRQDVRNGFTTRDDRDVPLVPSKMDVHAEEDRTALNISLYGNPFGPRQVDPNEMEIAKRELERIAQAHSGLHGVLPGAGGGSSEEEAEAGWSASEDEDEDQDQEAQEMERKATTLPSMMMTEEQELEAAIEASMSR